MPGSTATTRPEGEPADRRRFVDDLRAALPAWLVARALVLAGYAVAQILVDELRPGRGTVQLDQGLFAWDAAFYRDIADGGYSSVAQEGLRFFPLLPVLARALSVPLFGQVGLALVVITEAAALVAGAMIRRLVWRETADRAAADRAPWLLALLPPAAVLVLGYAESLFLVGAMATFLALRERRWGWAVVGGLLTGLCRPTGIVLVVPALIEVSRHFRGVSPSQLAGRAAAVAAPIVGVGGYLAWVQRTQGDWRLPIRLQNVEGLRGGWVDPIGRLADSARGLLGSERLGDGLHAPWAIFFALLAVVAFRRLPASYGAFATVLVVLALAGRGLGSFERYGLASFPLVMALALVVRREEWERVVLAASGAGLVAFSTLLFVGAFVP